MGIVKYDGKFTRDMDGSIRCTCGSYHFRGGMHSDFSDKAVTEFRCSKCGRVLIQTVFREMP